MDAVPNAAPICEANLAGGDCCHTGLDSATKRLWLPERLNLF